MVRGAGQCSKVEVGVRLWDLPIRDIVLHVDRMSSALKDASQRGLVTSLFNIYAEALLQAWINGEGRINSEKVHLIQVQ
jgi:hypothetical protein